MGALTVDPEEETYVDVRRAFFSLSLSISVLLLTCLPKQLLAAETRAVTTMSGTLSKSGNCTKCDDAHPSTKHVPDNRPHGERYFLTFPLLIITLEFSG